MTKKNKLRENLGLKDKKEKFRAEFNMGVADIECIDVIRRKLIMAAYMARGGDIDYCPIYYSLLYQFYLEIKRFLDDTQIKEFDNAFTEIEEMLEGGEDEFYKLPKKLDNIYENLNELRQILGLGIPVSKLRKGIRKDFK